MARKFTWDAWSYDCDGEAYVIARDECPERDNVPEWIVKTDKLSPECLNPAHCAHLSVRDVRQGWCKYQVRTDWDNGDGSPMGGYLVRDGESPSEMLRKDENGRIRKMPGWFPVWIVRKGDWY